MPALLRSFAELRVDPELSAVRQSIEPDMQREPDKVLAFFARMPLLYGDDIPAASSYTCPMHPERDGRGAGYLPEVRDEAGGGGTRGYLLHLPDAPAA